MPQSDPIIIPVELGDRRYPIVISSGTTDCAADKSCHHLGEHLLDSLGDVSHAVMIYDVAVKQSAAASVLPTLQSRMDRVDAVEVKSGETSKSIENLGRLWNRLIDVNTDRRSVVVAVGGGVVGDLAGFVGGAYTRGLRFVQVPTTLLAMVDSSVGGKTGINLPGGKNMVGSFWQPHLVWIDTDFMATLPKREYLSGLAEVIKYGVIEDAEFFDYLEDNMQSIVERDPQSVRQAIARSCQSKARVVADDERETSGRRAILNYGHTFAHAIEATAGYGTMLHGEAVAIGMQMAARLAVALGKCDADLIDRQTRLLDNAGLPLVWPEANPEAMIPVMARDKKVAHGKLRFVLPDRIGHVELVGDVPVDQVSLAIEACR